jgi:general secretion pathway protein D
MNLQILLPLETEISVNESANSLVMVAPARDVRRALKIVNALDTSMSISASIQVFRLHYADAKQLATEIMTLFSPNTQGGMGGMGRAMMFMNMMRGGGGGGGPGGGMGGGAGGSPSGTKVAATSDDYSNSLIVNAAPEVMETITTMVKEVDIPTTDITEVKIFQLKHADANQLADQLAQLFPDTSRTDNGPGFGMRFGGFGPFGGGRGNQATSNTRDKKMSQVIAVPEPRTRSIMVSAAQQLMPHIAEMIEKLDVDARHEVVKVYELANADPQDVQQILQDLFQRSGSIRANNNNNRNSLLGTGNPLTQRASQNQQNSSSTSSSFGSGGGSRGGGAGGGGGMSF